MKEYPTHTISIYITNNPGGLMRMCQIFSRRGFNIDSLVASPAMDGRFSRVTIAAKGAAESLKQIILQLEKLVDVMHCIEHKNSEAIVREMVLIKVLANSANRGEILQITKHFGGKTVDFTDNSLVIECSGASSKLDAMIDLLENYEIVEMVRSGQMLVARGDQPT
ncbi:acetolactate synthase small subunit [Lentisphaera profundi]|uniref:Acetolactate synthase small subunit n=1 Tax=Lentisphaera profundi TaxID=1658616 RepID=A0ABY7VYJ1_9BACT|nr:acetolactate synthase small subunit [Lentisphaera profundi]WDE97932.1 acetolactate synthase small subunit [Lentisphaera profundi]